MYFACLYACYILLHSDDNLSDSHFYYLILHRRKLWLKEIKYLSQGHIARIGPDLNLGSSDINIFNCCDDDQSSKYGLHIRIIWVCC